jgi:hypothetical protein
MKNSPQAWERLAAAARRYPDERDVQAPFGFATRVAALAMAAERPVVSFVENFSLRAMFAACALAAVVVAANYSSIRSLYQEPAPVASDDPVAEMIDLAS